MSELETRYYEFLLEGDRSVVIETAEPAGTGGGPVSTGRLVERAKQSFQEVISRIPAILEPIHAQLVNSIPMADEVLVEFGFKVSGDFGVIIAKTQAEANFKIAFKLKGAEASKAKADPDRGQA